MKRCTRTVEYSQGMPDTGDPQVARHLSVCPECRAEADKYQRLAALLATLPAMPVPVQASATLDALARTTAERSLTCDETLALLEAWREGAVDRVQTFLVEDHLLWCEPCARALARAEQITGLLQTLPPLNVPDAVAERIAHARLPWWQRVLPAPAPTLSRQWGFAGALSAAALVLVVLLSRAIGPGMQVAQKPELSVPTPSTYVQPKPVVPPTPLTNPRPAPTIEVAMPRNDTRPDKARPDAISAPVGAPRDTPTAMAPIGPAPARHPRPPVVAVVARLPVGTPVPEAPYDSSLRGGNRYYPVDVPVASGQYVYEAEDAVVDTASTARVESNEEALSSGPDRMDVSLAAYQPPAELNPVTPKSTGGTAAVTHGGIPGPITIHLPSTPRQLPTYTVRGRTTAMRPEVVLVGNR